MSTNNKELKEKELRQKFTDSFGAVTVLGRSRNEEIADWWLKEIASEKERLVEEIENRMSGFSEEGEETDEFIKGRMWENAEICSIIRLMKHHD